MRTEGMMRRFRLCRILGLFLLGSLAAVPRPGSVTASAQRSLAADETLQVLITTSELVVGKNRFAFGLLQDHTFLANAQVMLRVYALQGQEGQLQAEVPVLYWPLEVVEQRKRLHVHPDGSRHVHDEETDVQGIYVAHVVFERAGAWGLEVRARQGDGPVAVSRFTVSVLDTAPTPALGTPAPRSHNLIASDVPDLRHIDSSDPPDPRLHQARIAEAIEQGKPQVIVFASPKLCTSRICGPVVDIVRLLLPTYGGRVVFTHQEIWQDAARQRFFSTVEEWKLQTEPWIFVVDAQGMIRAKFEGLATKREIDAVLQQIVDQP